MGIFSRRQIDLIGGKKRVKWEVEDIAQALAMKSISPKAYQTLRLVWKLPLPCVRTLVNWAQRFKCRSGILSDVLQVLKAEGHNLDSFSKQCVLCFDEMSVSSEIVWDKSMDEIVGPHSHAQVVLVIGLFSKWKQPIFYDFDTPIDKKLLNQLIFDTECLGFPVMATVSDQGGSNQGLGTELGISIKHTSLENPYESNRRIWMFYDAHHIIKLLKSHLIDHGLVLSNSTLINKSTILNLICNNGTEFCYSSGMTLEILELAGAERMKVGPVLKFFSLKTAALAELTYPQQPEIGKFFRTVYEYIQVFSSRIPFDREQSIQSGFGNALSEQNGVLDRMTILMESMRVRFFKKDKVTGIRHLVQRKSILPFQRGALLSMSSLKGLLNDANLLGAKFILTSRLLQDPIESLFSVIRSFGRTHDHPNPSQFKYRLRLILLGSKVRPPTASNVQFDTCSISYVSSKLLEGVKNEASIEGRANSTKMANFYKKKESRETKRLNNKSFPIPLTKAAELTRLPDRAIGFLAGYIAYAVKKRTKKVYGEITRKTPLSEMPGDSSNSREDFAWIYALSRGGLLKPNDLMLESVRRCEEIFSLLIPTLESVRNVTGISRKVFDGIISVYPDIDPDIINPFIRTRLSMRVRFWNKERTNSKHTKLKSKLFCSSASSKPVHKSRNAKKVQHFIKSSK